MIEYQHQWPQPIDAPTAKHGDLTYELVQQQCNNMYSYDAQLLQRNRATLLVNVTVEHTVFTQISDMETLSLCAIYISSCEFNVKTYELTETFKIHFRER